MFFPEYNKLKECWVGKTYDSSLVEDTFIKDILDETEEDLLHLCKILTDNGVVVKRPTYKNPDVRIKPQLLHARDHLQFINNKLYVGPRYEENIKDWLELLDNRYDYVTLDNLCAPSVVRANRLYFDATAWTRKRFEYFKNANSNIECVYEKYSCRDFNIERHTDGVFCVVKEGVIISTPQGRNLEHCFPNWDILYLDHNSQDLNAMAESKNNFIWHPTSIPKEYREWVGYSPETFFDVNALALSSEVLLVTRYNKKVFDFLKLHNVEPVIVPFRHRYLWDGGLHCMTFDLLRNKYII
jgi:hypothetical protein